MRLAHLFQTCYAIDLILSTTLSVAQATKTENGGVRSARLEDRWQIPLDAGKSQFDIDELLTEQVNSLKALFEGNHAFVNLSTGHGKSF